MLIKHDVGSSMIKAMAYDPDEKKLWLTFKSDALYEYRGVDQSLVNGFLEAESKGKYFRENIKDAPELEFEKVEQ
jgi:hypothetical protein